MLPIKFLFNCFFMLVSVPFLLPLGKHTALSLGHTYSGISDDVSVKSDQVHACARVCIVMLQYAIVPA